MIPSTLIVAMMALAAEAVRPAPASGWSRVGCIRLEESRNENFRSSFKLSDQNTCLEQCGSNIDSTLAMIGDKCWCSSPDLHSLTILDGGDFNCAATCYPDDPDADSCGSFFDGVQYYDLYQQKDCEINVLNKPGYPVPPPNMGFTSSAVVSTPTAARPTAAKPTAATPTTTPAKSITKTSGSGSGQASTTAATGPGATTTSTACSGTYCSPPATATSSGSKPYLSGVFSASIMLMMASFLV